MVYKTENEIEAFLRNGNVEERIMAICSMDTTKELWEKYWDIFLTDESVKVQCNALCGACHTDPDKIYYMLEYILKSKMDGMLYFTKIISEHFLREYKKQKI